MSLGENLEVFVDLAQHGVGSARDRAQAELDKQPELLPHSLFFWTAFGELHTDRPLGFDGAGRIPLSAIRAYADDLAMTDCERDEFKRVIMAVDARREVVLRAKRKDQGKRP